MADETSAASAATPVRRRTRRITAGTTTSRTASGTRRRRLRGPELVESLNQMVDQLIKENRKLKRQVDRLSARGTAVTSTTVERGLRGIQRRVQRAIDVSGTSRRKTTRRRAAGNAGTATRRRATTARREAGSTASSTNAGA